MVDLYRLNIDAYANTSGYKAIVPVSRRHLAMAPGIDRAEAALLALPQAEAQVFHYFAPGLYIREVHLPKGCMAIGHEQRFPHWNIFLKGKVKMRNEDGTHTILEAPMQFVGQPGRKVGEILEDVVWQNVYATEETDIEKLEALFIVKSEGWKTAVGEKACREYAAHVEDRRDFRRLLREWGFTEWQARAESERTGDIIPFPQGPCGVKLGPSPIEGKGLFATRNFVPGELIAPANLGGFRTPAGRFTNHSAQPNAEFRREANGDILLYALKPLRGCLAGFDGDEVTVDYRQALTLSGRMKRSLKCPQ